LPLPDFFVCTLCNSPGKTPSPCCSSLFFPWITLWSDLQTPEYAQETDARRINLLACPANFRSFAGTGSLKRHKPAQASQLQMALLLPSIAFSVRLQFVGLVAGLRFFGGITKKICQ